MGTAQPPPGTELWILAGQSNMQGSAPYVEDYPLLPNLWVYDMDGLWGPAVPPMHHIFCARQPAHRLLWLNAGHDPALLDDLAARGRAATLPTTGPAYFFGRFLLRHLPPGRHIALLPCAHGGTTLEQWSPAAPGQPGETLYSAMLAQVRASGLTPRGLLWYQGESDANPQSAPNYADRFSAWITRLRRDLAQPAFPVCIVQIGNVAGTLDGVMDSMAWTQIREAQRLVAAALPGVYLTSAVDLALCDMIHIDLEGAELAGERLARLALTHVYSAGAFGSSIQFRALETGLLPWRHPLLQFDLPTITLHFSGVTGAFRSSGRPAGFSIQSVQPEALGIWRTELNAAGSGTIRLYLNSLAGGAPLSVAYGAGFNPYCNVVDEAGMSLPAFGPLQLDYPLAAVAS